MKGRELFTKREMARGAKYALVGSATLGFDLLLLFTLVEYASWPEFVAAPFAFLIAVSVNYFISRQFVFSGTSRGLGRGYIMFVVFAVSAATALAVLMFITVSILGYNYLVSRIVIATIIGIGNYFANTFLNFRVQENW